MKRRIIIAGNWKMNKTVDEAVELGKAIKIGLAGFNAIDLLVCPPSINILALVDLLKDCSIEIGAQNMHFEKNGAFTGEISADMILSSGANNVILGHSERRHVFGETDSFIAKKIKTALDTGLKAILCIGEKLDQREAGQTESILETQLSGALEDIQDSQLENLIIAYEPVWAIGTGKTATSAQAQEAHLFIREWLANKYSTDIAAKIRILYGGSVKPNNAFELLSCKDVDGALIGGASLKAESFVEISKEAIRVLENNKI